MAQSTTREVIHTLHAGLNEIIFNDTKPNHVYINNLSTSDLFLGVSVIPDADTYDKWIAPASDGLWARELGVTRIQLYVNGADNTRVQVTSFEGDFNPTTLASASDTVANSGGGGGAAFDGIIRGFNAPLPSGGNNIGKVVVSEMPAFQIEQKPLVAGSANIGKVDIASMPSLPVGANKIGNVGIAGGVTIDAMPPVSLNGDVTVGDISIKGEGSFFSIDEAITTTEIVKTLAKTSRSIKYITNDGDTDLYIAFDTATTDTAAGNNGRIRLLAGETLNELNIAVTTIKFKRPSGTGNVRGVVV